MKIITQQQRRFKFISYGLYEASDDSQLDQILKSQFIVSNPPTEILQLLDEEIGKAGQEQEEYREFLIGQKSYLVSLKGDYNAACQILTTSSIKFKSLRSIFLYFTYLIGLEKQEQNESAISALPVVAKLLSTSFIRYPIQSEILERYYLRLLFHELYKYCSQLNFKEIVELFNNNYNLIISLCSYFHGEFGVPHLDALEEYIARVSDKILNSHGFPKATEIRTEVEDFVVTLCQNCELYGIITLPKLKKIVITSFERSFHNLRILKQYIVILIHEGVNEEIKPCFDVYVDYVQKARLQHGNEYVDLLDTVDIFVKVLKYTVLHNFESEFVAITAKELSVLLHFLADDMSLGGKFLAISADHDDDAHDQLEGDQIFAIPAFNRLISEGWYALAIADKYLGINCSSDTKDLNRHLQNAVKNFKRCLQSNAEKDIDPKHYFEFALVYAKLNKLKTAIKLMKKCCLHDKENLQYWNLLTLLYSTEENYQSAETLINNAILLMNAKLEEDQYVSSLSIEQRQDIIQLKMTQIALVELMNNDTSLALQCVPDLFAVYARLFQHHEDGESTVKTSRQPINGEGNGNSNPLKKILTRSSIAISHRSSSVMVQKHHNHDQFQASAISAQKLFETLGDHILQKLWLWIANLYLKAQMFTEAENCIVEAENIGITSYTRSKFAMLLLLTERRAGALKEFEKAIELDSTNLEAVLGLSKLILSDQDADKSASVTSIFSSVKDQRAAELNLKLLLEKFEHSYKYCQVTEVFWYLSILNEKYKDLERCQKCLWRCVELEENKPVRGFECLEDYI